MTPEKKPASWDPVWDDLFKTESWGKYPAEDLIRFVARNYYKSTQRKNTKILEVGCGPGANLWFLAREGFTVYGIDGSSTAVKAAKERLDTELNGWSGEIVVGDILSLPYPECFFDSVIDSECIYSNSFENSKIIYQEIKRILKPGGKVFSRTFATGTWGDNTGEKIGHHFWLTAEGPFHNRGQARFTDETEIPELLGPGFTLEELNLLSRTIPTFSSGKTIREWLITGVKD